MSKLKVCFVSGSRADYGLIFWPMKEIQNDPAFELQVAVTGMHLSEEFGLTYKVIEADGFRINAKVDIDLNDNSTVGVTKSMGRGVIGFADAFEQLAPDIIVLLGDRYEIFAAAQAALLARIPIAHIAGGDTTEGAFDEAIRHSITKMSHIHFVTNDDSAARVKQLGENPKHVFTVGSPGIDFIKRIKLLSREELETSLGLQFKKKNILVTFHPVTLVQSPSSVQIQELFAALDQLQDVGIIITKPNADTDGKIIIDMIDQYIKKNPNAHAYTSLGQLRYLSLMSIVDAVVGNSSSGLYEAPSFKKPTVNIGDRQKGRLQPDSVINCLATQASISKAMASAFEFDCSQVVNPYGDGQSSIRIRDILKGFKEPKKLIAKHFFLISGVS